MSLVAMKSSIQRINYLRKGIYRGLSRWSSSAGRSSRVLCATRKSTARTEPAAAVAPRAEHGGRPQGDVATSCS